MRVLLTMLVTIALAGCINVHENPPAKTTVVTPPSSATGTTSTVVTRP
jgi:hypothetical protein